MTEQYPARRRDDEEHREYHATVSLLGCGVPGCDFRSALAMHFDATRPTEPRTPAEWAEWGRWDEDDDD